MKSTTRKTLSRILFGAAAIFVLLLGGVWLVFFSVFDPEREAVFSERRLRRQSGIQQLEDPETERVKTAKKNAPGAKAKDDSNSRARLEFDEVMKASVFRLGQKQARASLGDIPARLLEGVPGEKIVELNAIAHSPMGAALSKCLLGNWDSFRKAGDVVGVDIFDLFDRMISTERGAAVTGHFSKFNSIGEKNRSISSHLDGSLLFQTRKGEEDSAALYLEAQGETFWTEDILHTLGGEYSGISDIQQQSTWIEPFLVGASRNIRDVLLQPSLYSAFMFDEFRIELYPLQDELDADALWAALLWLKDNSAEEKSVNFLGFESLMSLRISLNQLPFLTLVGDIKATKNFGESLCQDFLTSKNNEK